MEANRSHSIPDVDRIRAAITETLDDPSAPSEVGVKRADDADLVFGERGFHHLKGIPDAWEVFEAIA